MALCTGDHNLSPGLSRFGTLRRLGSRRNMLEESNPRRKSVYVGRRTSRAGVLGFDHVHETGGRLTAVSGIQNPTSHGKPNDVWEIYNPQGSGRDASTRARKPRAALPTSKAESRGKIGVVKAGVNRSSESRDVAMALHPDEAATQPAVISSASADRHIPFDIASLKGSKMHKNHALRSAGKPEKSLHVDSEVDIESGRAHGLSHVKDNSRAHKRGYKNDNGTSARCTSIPFSGGRGEARGGSSIATITSAGFAPSESLALPCRRTKKNSQSKPRPREEQRSITSRIGDFLATIPLSKLKVVIGKICVSTQLPRRGARGTKGFRVLANGLFCPADICVLPDKNP